MQQQTHKYDVIVVGAGHNGLVAAHNLAKRGLDVLILERRSIVGGLAITEEVFPGYRANSATNSAHSVEPSVISEMRLHEHGLRFEMIEPSSFMMTPEGDKLLGWHDRSKMADEIARFSSADRDNYFRLLGELHELGEALDVSFFEPPPGLADLTSRLQSRRHERLFAKFFFGSVCDLVHEYLESEVMRASIGLVPISGTMVAPSAPGSAYMLMHRALHRGSKATRDRPNNLTSDATTAPFTKAYPIGGSGAITQAMASAARAQGVTIMVESEVAHVKCDSGRAQGVLLSNGQEFDAPIVISNLNPKVTLLQLVSAEDLPQSFRDEVEEVVMDGCVSKVIVAMDGLPRFACATSDSENTLLLRSAFRTSLSVSDADAATAAAWQGEWWEVPMIYGLIQSVVDPDLTPAGKHVMSLSVTGSPYKLAEGDWLSRRDEWARHVLKTLSRYIPNLDDIVTDYRCATPLDLEREFGLLGANLSHGDLTVDRVMSWGPTPPPGCSDHTTPIEGLYMCSVGTWPANFFSGIPGTNTAVKVLQDLQAGVESTRRARAGGRPEIGVN